MSGRPHGPYTVKNRNPVAGRPNRWLYVWAISSLAFFVAAYRLTGWSVLSCSLKRSLRLAPYTLELLGIDQVLATLVTAALEDVEKPDHIALDIGVRVAEGIAHACLRGQMDYPRDLALGEQRGHRCAVRNVEAMETEPRLRA